MKLRAMMLVTAMLLCGSALSQTMYKCGRTYQDRPCDDGKGRSMGAATSSPGVTSGPTDAECVQRGQDSLKIVWAREGGATEERMLAEAPTPAQRRLVQEVYRKRGSASQIQSAIATDCIAQKQQIERDAALAAAAAVRAQREGTPSVSASTEARPAGNSQAVDDGRAAAIAADRKKQECAGYNADLEAVRAQERTGGSAQTMDRLAESRRRIAAQASRAGC
jgi:hypothetical protein